MKMNEKGEMMASVPITSNQSIVPPLQMAREFRC
jgi:hypothetical protein